MPSEEPAVIELPDLASLQHYAARFVERHPEGGLFGLQGELGVGKTSFVREVVGVLTARAGAGAPRVVSPSYVLHQLYELGPSVDHFDLYRLESLTEEGLMELGYYDAVERCARGGFGFVEWAERLPEKARPAWTLVFEFRGNGRRVSERLGER
jgi:tRNA threonylcarbamoyl adenosine modification protein YjeE